MRRELLAGIAAIVAAWFVPALAAATPGDLDRTFSGDGRIAGPTDSEFTDVVVQTDAKVVAIQRNPLGGEQLVRFDSRGRLDPSFGGDGSVRTLPSAAGLELGPDGKLTVIGSLDSITLARYLPDGSPDPAFGTRGVVVSHVEGSVEATAVTAAGEIVAAGRIAPVDPDQDGTDIFAARFTPSGTLDPAFSGDGLARWVSAPGDYNTVGGVAVAPDGAVVIAAAIDDPLGETYEDAAALRFTSAGDLDSSFSGDGVAHLRRPGFERARDLALLPDGEVVLVGAGDGPDLGGRDAFDVLVARLTPSGEPDATFASNGILAADFIGDDEVVNAVLPAPAGGLYLVGSGGGYGDFLLLSLTADGTVDEGFGRGGVVLTPFSVPRTEDRANAAALTPDGRIVVAGHTDARGTPAGSFVDRGVLLRYRTAASGPDNRDGDRLRDAKDGCPWLPSRDRSGCPVHRGTTSIRYSRRVDDFAGTIRFRPDRNPPYECASGARVSVMRERRGRDELIGTTTSVSRGKWELSSLQRAGRFYASVRRHRQRGLGICAGMKSATINLGGSR